MMLKKLKLALLGLLLCVGASAWAQEDNWPSGPITLVLGFAPGGPNDLVARALALRLTDQLKQSVVVENRPGANANIAAGLVARAKPNGYTFLYNSTSLAISPAMYKQLNYDALKDLTPVSATATLPMVLVVEKSAPVNNMKEWIAYVRSQPGKMNYGTGGTGNLSHLAMAVILDANGLKAEATPYKGMSEAMSGLLGNYTQFQLDSVNSPLPLIKSGKLKALFVTSGQRSAVLPDVPTLIESGLDLNVTAWQGIMAPAGTPPAIVQKMSAEVVRAMNSPQMKATLEAQGAYGIAGTPAEYDAMFRRDMKNYEKAVRQLNLPRE